MGLLWNLILLCSLTARISSQDLFSPHSQDDLVLENEFNSLSSNVLDNKSYFKADRGFLIRQRAILKAFHHYRCPSAKEHDDFYRLSQSYNPKDHSSSYEDPDLVEKFVTELEAGKYFSRYAPFTYEPTPVAQMKDLISILDDAFRNNADLFYKTLAYFFTRINVSMLYTAVSVITSSFRMQGYRLPPPIEVIPQIYTPKDIVYQANEADLRSCSRTPLVLTSRTGPTPPEGSLSWFREDANINAFHFLWHVDFPSWFNQSVWRPEYHKDRKGELFMNMHHYIVGRYFSERIALGYGNIDVLDVMQPINPPTNPNVLELNLKEYPPRGPGILLSENYVIKDYGVNTSKTLVKSYETRIRQGLTDGYFTAANGTQISVRDENGSNTLGNTLESNQDSVDRIYYGNLHNLCHLIISRTSDPDGSLGLNPGYALHQENTMMDPVFFRIHLLVDTLNKQQLDYYPPHTKEELDYAGVEITGLKVQTKARGVATNELQTFYRNSSWDVSNSISESGTKCNQIADAKVYSSVKMLHHREFDYILNVNSNGTRRSVVRIFMAPSEYFDGQSPTMDQFRWSFFEMDRFPVQLKNGANKITRPSFDNSNAGAPYASSAELYSKVEIALRTNRALYVNKYSRNCGWPRNYYLPIGRPGNGMGFKLFAMLTDFDADFKIDFEEAKRLQSLSMCGVSIGDYPDRRPMGFPFSRRIEHWEDFFPRKNMHMVDVIIKNLG